MTNEIKKPMMDRIVQQKIQELQQHVNTITDETSFKIEITGLANDFMEPYCFNAFCFHPRVSEILDSDTTEQEKDQEYYKLAEELDTLLSLGHSAVCISHDDIAESISRTSFSLFLYENRLMAAYYDHDVEL